MHVWRSSPQPAHRGPELTQALIRFATEPDVGKSELRAGLDAAGVLVIERLMNLCSHKVPNAAF